MGLEQTGRYPEGVSVDTELGYLDSWALPRTSRVGRSDARNFYRGSREKVQTVEEGGPQSDTYQNGRKFDC